MIPRDRVVAGAAALIALLAGPASAIAGAAAPPPPSQALVVLLAAHDVRSAPSSSAPTTTTVQARRPLTGTPTTLPVLATVTDGERRTWLRVRLPGRQLGLQAPPRTGWIAAARTRSSTTAWRLLVDLRHRRVTVLREGRPVRRFGAIIGAGSTPTPRGAFFVEENVRVPARRVGGPFALALSARSSTLQHFDGGPGQVALHGRRALGGALGTAVSHGCVRLDDRAITWLAARIRPGVPVAIT